MLSDCGDIDFGAVDLNAETVFQHIEHICRTPAWFSLPALAGKFFYFI